jgi:hypothetical protein
MYYADGLPTAIISGSVALLCYSMVRVVVVKEEARATDIFPEVCICAAVVSVDGLIIRCHRHSDGIITLGNMGRRLERSKDGQGFITSRNRYVNRSEGALLQQKAKVPSPLQDGEPFTGTTLFSEDLY